MILQRRIKLKAAGWSDLIEKKDVQLHSLDSHGVHGAEQIEVYDRDFRLTMAVGSELIYSNGIIFKGFVPRDEQNWEYQYHVEEWTLLYGGEK